MLIAQSNLHCHVSWWRHFTVFFLVQTTLKEESVCGRSFATKFLHFAGRKTFAVRSSYELRVIISCTSWDCIVDCVNFLLYQLFISMACSLQNQVLLVSYSWAMYFMNKYSNVKLWSAVLSCVNLFTFLTIYFLQRGVFLTTTVHKYSRKTLIS